MTSATSARPALSGPAPADSPAAGTQRRGGLRIALTVATAGVLVATTPGTASAAHPALPPNLPTGVELFQPYVGQSGCDPVAKPGVAAFQSLLMNTYRDTESYGIVRDCGIGGQSEHKEGRAFDWKVSASNPTQVAEVKALTDWLTGSRDGEPAVMLRRFGIMYMIWNHQIFKAYQPEKGWQPYSGSSPHTDHVHFSFGWNGAKKATSWWSGKVAAVDYGPYATAPVPPVPVFSPVASPANLKTLAVYGGTSLRYGSTGEAVKIVQAGLEVTADGQFGRITEAKVKGLQTAFGLPVTGVFGPAEWRVLFPKPTNPFGRFESVSSTALTGWAADADTTAPIRVQVLVDKVAVKTVLAGVDRPDLGDTYPGVGTAHGYSIPVRLTPGAHQVCVVGVNVGAGANTSTGCASITVLPPSALAASSSRGSSVDLFSRSDAGVPLRRELTTAGLSKAKSLGGSILGAPSAVERTSTTQEVFARGTDDDMFIKTLRPDGTYSTWKRTYSTITSRPAAATRAGRVDVVARGASGRLMHRWSDSPGMWSSWESLGGSVLPDAAPALAWTPGGRLDAFVVGSDHAIYRRSMSRDGVWGAWSSLGGVTSSDLTATASSTKYSTEGVTVVYRRLSGRGYARIVGSREASGWTRLAGRLASAPAIVAAPGARTAKLFTLGMDGRLYLQTRVGTAGWSGWNVLG